MCFPKKYKKTASRAKSLVGKKTKRNPTIYALHSFFNVVLVRFLRDQKDTKKLYRVPFEAVEILGVKYKELKKYKE